MREIRWLVKSIFVDFNSTQNRKWNCALTHFVKSEKDSPKIGIGDNPEDSWFNVTGIPMAEAPKIGWTLVSSLLSSLSMASYDLNAICLNLSSFSNSTLNWFKMTVSLNWTRSEIHCHISVCDDGFILTTRKARQRNDPRSQTEQRFASHVFRKIAQTHERCTQNCIGSLNLTIHKLISRNQILLDSFINFLRWQVLQTNRCWHLTLLTRSRINDDSMYGFLNHISSKYR
jgi:hypothetical protein